MKCITMALLLMFSSVTFANANCCVLINNKLRCQQEFQLVINSIRAEYAAVNQNQGRYRVVQKVLHNYDAPEANATLYYQDQDLRKIAVKVYGEAGYTVDDYYFYRGQLFFLFSVSYQYDPKTYFSGGNKVVGKVERRYYFADGRLIRWLGNDNVPEQCTLQNYLNQQVFIQNQLIGILSNN